MNLFEFYQQNNNEMGVYFTKESDLELFNATYEGVPHWLEKRTRK